MPKYPVGLEVRYSRTYSNNTNPATKGALVAFIGEDPVNPGSELWWAWLGTEKLGRVSVGKYWLPENEPEKKEETEIEALKRVNTLLWKALRGVGAVRQFPNQLCWCNTIARTHCVGQPQCKEAQAALDALCDLQALEIQKEKKHGK